MILKKYKELMDKELIISEIIKMEIEITQAIFNGHKADQNDKFKTYRELLKTYRKILKNDSINR